MTNARAEFAVAVTSGKRILMGILKIELGIGTLAFGLPFGWLSFGICESR
jgi:hypothetical protein